MNQKISDLIEIKALGLDSDAGQCGVGYESLFVDFGPNNLVAGAFVGKFERAPFLPNFIVYFAGAVGHVILLLDFTRRPGDSFVLLYLIKNVSLRADTW